MIRIDGSKGEGGGQILRSALSLSAATGQPFEMVNIRAGREKPGLMRQHLACVRAAAEICGGYLDGAELKSQTLRFTPGDIRYGDFSFAIGSAGSTTLLFQTILPVLAMADGPSRVTVSGGTHNPGAPTYDMIAGTYLPVLARIGLIAHPQLLAHGFFPAGGGEWSAQIEPAESFAPLDMCDEGSYESLSVTALLSALAPTIGERELKIVQQKLPIPDERAVIERCKAQSPGNALTVTVDWPGFREQFVNFGENRVRAEWVADKLAQTVRRYLKSGAPVGPYLADQLLVPLALGGGGTFLTQPLTPHFETNMATIKAFLDVDIECESLSSAQIKVSVHRG